SSRGSVLRLNLTSSTLNGTLLDFPFSSLPSLTYFELSVNELYGTIPSQIGLLTNLLYLYLSLNLFTGSIPPEIGLLTKLDTLHLTQLELNGSIPHQIGNLVSLTELALYTCLIWVQFWACRTKKH
ncbi:MDIS1-interacting receptor like kinase 2, partial [Linum perenne]